MSEVRVVATLIAKPEHRSAVRDAAEKLVEPTREETGNLRYDLHEESSRPGTYVFFEIWESEAALDQHEASGHFKGFAKEVDGKLELLDIKKLHQIA